jgi:hypothetical protein
LQSAPTRGVAGKPARLASTLLSFITAKMPNLMSFIVVARGGNDEKTPPLLALQSVRA